MKKLMVLLVCLLALEAMAQEKGGAVLTPKEEVYDFDTLAYGSECYHVFEFTNTGDQPLVINRVLTSCGCDMADYKKAPVQPGEKVFISYRYDSKREGIFKKNMTITGNFSGGVKIIRIQGYVLPEKPAENK